MAEPFFVVAAERVLPALLAGALVAAAAVYGEGYFDAVAERRAFRALLCVFFFSVIGAVFSSSWLVFFVFVEISTVALFLMIAIQRRDVAEGYLQIQLVGASFFLAGIAGASIMGGALLSSPVPRVLLPLFILGLGVKAALPGLHFWLPEVHGTAPAPVSALLSGFAVKLGVFGFLAALPSEPHSFLLAAGAFMALWGAFRAALQPDVKRLLAYSTMSQLGYIVAAAAAGSQVGTAAAIFHTAVHGLVKGMLFFCAGILEKTYGTKKFSGLGGGAAALPWTFFLFVFAAASLLGLPGTPGFASKGLIKEALHGFSPISLCLLAANVGTAVSFFKMGAFAFGGVQKSPRKILQGRLRLMNGGMLMLVVFLLPLGLFPGWAPSFLGVEGIRFYSFAKCAESLSVALAGALLFAAYRKKPGFADALLRRIDEAGSCFSCVSERGGAFVRSVQSGFLRGYLFAAVATALLLMLWFSR